MSSNEVHMWGALIDLKWTFAPINYLLFRLREENLKGSTEATLKELENITLLESNITEVYDVKLLLMMVTKLIIFVIDWSHSWIHSISGGWFEWGGILAFSKGVFKY